VRYFIVKPDFSEQEITNDVLRGANNVTEFVFDLDDAVIPADVRLTLSNNQGAYSPEVEIFRDFDINQLLVKILDNAHQLLFIGILADIDYNLNEAVFRVSNVITQLLDQSVSALSMTATPTEILHKLLRLASIPENLTDVEQFKRLNFIFSKLTDLESAYPGGGVNAVAGTVDWSLLEKIEDVDSNLLFSFVSGKFVFKNRAEQKLIIEITEVTPIIDIIKEVTAQSGLFLYTESGVFTCRLYPFEQRYFDAPTPISKDSTEASSVKYKRPLYWRRSEVIVPYFDGTIKKASLKASDIAFSDSEFLEGIFSAKPVEFDGLGNKIFHEDLASATNALTTILLIRGPARFHSEFNLSLATTEGQDLLSQIELFKPFQIQFVDHCTNGLPIETRKLDDKVFIKVVSAAEKYEYRPEVITQIDNFEALGNQSLYPDDDSDLTFSGLTVSGSVEFLHRNNRANPALLSTGPLLILLNNTPNSMLLDFEHSSGSGQVTLEPDEFLEIVTTDTVLLSLTVTFITDCGDLSETYENVKALILTPSDNLLLTNYCTTLLTDLDGVISQVDI